MLINSAMGDHKAPDIAEAKTGKIVKVCIRQV